MIYNDEIKRVIQLDKDKYITIESILKIIIKEQPTLKPKILAACVPLKDIGKP